MKETPSQAMPPAEIIEKKPKSKKGGYRRGSSRKIGSLLAEIAHLQGLDNDYHWRHGRNWETRRLNSLTTEGCSGCKQSSKNSPNWLTLADGSAQSNK
jgi:hypothetical protein